MREVTDNQIRGQIADVMKENPHLKKCATCYFRDHNKKWCVPKNLAAPDYMYGCNDHITDEQYMIQQTRKRMEADAKREAAEDGEQNWRLTLSLDCLNAALRFLYDFETHAEAHYERAVKAKDLDEAAVSKKEKGFIKDMCKNYKKMIEGIEQAEKYYRHYISPYLNKVFKDADGQFCEKSYSDHESDGATIADLALEYADCTYGNEANRLKVIRFFEELPKAGIMSDKSKGHYKFRR